MRLGSELHGRHLSVDLVLVFLVGGVPFDGYSWVAMLGTCKACC
jgi:hypothetical protein